MTRHKGTPFVFSYHPSLSLATSTPIFSLTTLIFHATLHLLPRFNFLLHSVIFSTVNSLILLLLLSFLEEVQTSTMEETSLSRSPSPRRCYRLEVCGLLSIGDSLFTLTVSSGYPKKKKKKERERERESSLVLGKLCKFDWIPTSGRYQEMDKLLRGLFHLTRLRLLTLFFLLFTPHSPHLFVFFPLSNTPLSARKLLAFPIRVSSPDCERYFRFSRSPGGIREDARDYRVSLLPR